MLLKGIKEFGSAMRGSVGKAAKLLADGMKDVKENGLPEVTKYDIDAIVNKRTLGLDGVEENKDNKNKNKEENER